MSQLFRNMDAKDLANVVCEMLTKSHIEPLNPIIYEKISIYSEEA